MYLAALAANHCEPLLCLGAIVSAEHMADTGQQ